MKINIRKYIIIIRKGIGFKINLIRIEIRIKTNLIRINLI